MENQQQQQKNYGGCHFIAPEDKIEFLVLVALMKNFWVYTTIQKFRVNKIILKKGILLFSKDTWNWSKMAEDFYIVLVFWTFY